MLWLYESMEQWESQLWLRLLRGGIGRRDWIHFVKSTELQHNIHTMPDWSIPCEEYVRAWCSDVDFIANLLNQRSYQTNLPMTKNAMQQYTVERIGHHHWLLRKVTWFYLNSTRRIICQHHSTQTLIVRLNDTEPVFFSNEERIAPIYMERIMDSKESWFYSMRNR